MEQNGDTCPNIQRVHCFAISAKKLQLSSYFVNTSGPKISPLGFKTLVYVNPINLTQKPSKNMQNIREGRDFSGKFGQLNSAPVTTLFFLIFVDVSMGGWRWGGSLATPDKQD